MSVTLAWLLARRQLGLEQLEGPDPAGVEVRWAHAVELVDPTPWLEGGELVLTTGLRLPRSVSGLTSYVRRLAEAGAAGLGFGVGLEYAEAPATMRKACATAGLPLVIVPLPTPFLAVIRAIADHDAEQQRAALQDAAGFQQQLTRAALEHGTPGLVDALAARLSMPAVVLDDLGSVVAGGPADTALLERVRSEIGAQSPRAAGTLPFGDAALMLLRLVDGRRTRGWLAIAADRPTTSQERLLIGQVASMLTLQLTRSADLSDLYADVGGATADLALAGADASPLARFGLGGHEDVRVLVAGSTRDRPVSGSELADALEPLRRPHLSTTRAGQPVALLPGDVDEAGLAPVSRAFVTAGRLDVVLGLSGAGPAERLPAGLAEALRAVAAARTAGKPLVTYHSLELETLLDDDAVRRRVETLAGSGLARLLESPRSVDRELARTLRVYLETNGSWETASRRLGVHRHTLRQRIARVRELTGLDLDSAHTRAATLLVLLVQERGN